MTTTLFTGMHQLNAHILSVTDHLSVTSVTFRLEAGGPETQLTIAHEPELRTEALRLSGSGTVARLNLKEGEVVGIKSTIPTQTTANPKEGTKA